ncbi:MOSC domain-containing protein [Emticicia agri]|uniref:MOSC domain-containing protein n=1 Tax=Emticicia agri TaxID=2492393 RepID=A0A4Q5M2P2_9BACT|nr:MOSC N-terminal beta barrel domain-containing protein [Emticicia agri]RYU96626.1 MOSC domain-containing protein [Emticicia agri]
MAIIITEINIYPIKSLGGISLQTAEVEDRGLQYDRRWVLADGGNIFMTQRENEQMALIEVSIESDGLKVSHRKKDIAPLKVPFEPETNDNRMITIWDDVVRAIRVNDEADAWFTEVLGKETHLYYQPDDSIRLTDPKYSITHEEHTSFSDAYPVLIIGQSSLDFLNEKLEEKMEMKRFRPNLVFSGGEPHDEDNFRYFQVGEARLVGVKLCARCVLTTINPETAERGKEPLKTLTQYRRNGSKILFGQNLLVVEKGKIALGDEIILEI